MTYMERLVEASQHTITETAEFFNDKFGCPPLNDPYDNGCRRCRNCLECWEHWLKSDVGCDL